MRSGMMRSAIIGSVVIAGMALFGCATEGTAPGSMPTATLQTVQGDYDQAELQAEATTDALNELSISAPPDIPQAYQTFSKSTDMMLAAGDRIIAHADGMYFDGPAYFVEAGRSTTSCEFPRLKVRQNTRPADLGPHFDDISDSSWELKRAYRAFEFDISQIRNTLATDQSPRGLDSMDILFSKARIDSVHFEAAMERALAALDRAKAAKAAQTPPAGG